MSDDNSSALRAPFPAEKIKVRQGRNGQQLAYVEIADVIERLNDSLPSWSFEVVSHTILDEEVVVHARLRAGDVVKEEFGGSAITRSKANGAIVCLADDLKSAASDALKRAARLMGVALDLYRGGTDHEPVPSPPIQRQQAAASYAQLAKLRSVAAQKRVDLEVLVFDKFGCETSELSKSDASALIDHLLGNSPRNGTRVNGHVHRHA